VRLTLALPAGRALAADVDDADEAVGRMLLERLATTATALPAGASTTVDVGWATLRLRAAGQLVTAEEPGYGRDGEHFHPSLARTSRIWSVQQQLIARLNVEPEQVTATQFVHVSAGAMSAAEVVGHRGDDESGPFTGWTVVSATEVLETASFGYYTVRELARQRPAWLAAMILPRSWSFRFSGDTLIDCVSPAGETSEIGLSLPP
jgi:hypothetical protein